MTAPETDLSNANVLAVEDDTGNVALIGMALARLNMRSYIDTSGTDVVPIALGMKPPPDVILLDLNLPGGRSGFDIMQEIRTVEALRHIPVLAVSSMDARVAIPRCKRLGFKGFIAKPFRSRKFILALQRALAGEETWEAI
jgi:CheY-like chemotaxis protein